MRGGAEVDYSVGVGKGGEHECAWIQPAEEGCRYALKGEKNHIAWIVVENLLRDQYFSGDLHRMETFQ